MKTVFERTYGLFKIGDKIKLTDTMPVLYGVLMDKYLLEDNVLLDIILDTKTEPNPIIERKAVFAAGRTVIEVVRWQ